MKILYSHRTASKDGQAVHIEELIASFRRLGHEVVVIGPAFSERQEFGGESRLLALARRHAPRAVLELLEFGYSFVAYRELRHAYRKHRPDVLYQRYNLFFVAGVWLKRKFGIPFFLEVNAPIFEERLKYDGISLRRLARWTQHVTWRSADKTLPVSKALAAYISGGGVPDERIVVIPNGIDPRRFLAEFDREQAKQALGLGNRVVIGFTGFIREWHGLEQVIDWLGDRGPESRVDLVLVGDGPARAALERRAARLGVGERVRFTGLVGRDRIPEVVAAFDIALQPGVTSYASPLKILEYMALGCAIVAPRQGNIEELLADGESALMFDPDDAVSMQSCIDRLCRDRALRVRLGSAARELVRRRNLTWDHNAERLESLFRGEQA